MIRDFQKEHFTPDRCLIVANGIKEHKEFVKLVQEKIGDYFTETPEKKYERQPAKYTGGEFRHTTETPEAKIDLAFETVPWTSSDLPAFYVMNTLIGNATSFSSGGPGKGMYCRAITNLMQRYNFVDSASALNSHFSDSGLFGMSI